VGEENGYFYALLVAFMLYLFAVVWAVSKLDLLHEKRFGMGRFRSPSSLSRYREAHPICEHCGGNRVIGGRINGGVHHIEPRSRGGGDNEENLITLCTYCHSLAHDGKISQGELLISKGRFL